MFSDELREFLKKPHLARMSTIDPNGYPHTVPVWYEMDGEEFVITAPAETKKLNHIRANPKGCISIGGAPDDGGGWLFKGLFSLTDEAMWPWLEKMTYHYEPREQAEKDLALWKTWDIRIIRMKVDKAIRV
jgi:predicted pyridoxine 5'-phosphate oxidase superfamily flavin-nucleotide-binding protein